MKRIAAIAIASVCLFTGMSARGQADPSSSSTPRPAPSPSTRECDLAAADPNDDTRPRDIGGVTDAKLRSSKEAVASCKAALAAAPDNPRLLFQMGRLLAAAKDAPQALRYYQHSAALEFAPAEYGMATAYITGTPLVGRDVGRAASLIRKAADQGFAPAQSALGTLSARGIGMPQNLEAAAQWYSRAANQGFPPAEAYLAKFYLHGYGVGRNPTEALKWMRKAADQGFAPAQQAVGFFYFEGIGGLKKDDAQAMAWFRMAAAQDDPDAEHNIGIMYAQGFGVPRDEAQAVTWFSKAASRGDAASQAELAKRNRTQDAGVAAGAMLLLQQLQSDEGEDARNASRCRQAGGAWEGNMPGPGGGGGICWK